MAIGNSQQVADFIALESMRRLTNKCEIGSHFSTKANKEFQRSFPIGPTVRVPFPKQYIGHEGRDWAPEPIIDRYATISIDRFAFVDLEWDSVEKALMFPRGEEAISEDILGPATDTIKQKLEDACSLWAYQNTPNVVGINGTNPTTFDAFYGAASQRLFELGAPPTGPRTMCVTGGVGRALRSSVVSQFNPPDEMTKLWKSGAIGMKDRFETFESNSIYQHTSGTWQGAVTLTTTSITGATSIVVTCTTNDTFLKGDSFTISAVNAVNTATRRSTGTLKHWQVSESVTGASSTATIQLVASSSQGAIIGPGSPYQNVDALPLSGATLVLMPGTTSPNGKTGSQNLAFTDDAFGLVSKKLDMPSFSAQKNLSAEMSSYATDPNTGITINMLRQYDGKTLTWINRLGVMYGLGNFYNDTCSVRCLGA